MSPVDLRHLGPLYHSYRLLGGINEQLPGIYAPNQACKEPILIAYIQYAIAKCRATLATPVSFAELFCADGYYAMLARHLGATASMGIDNDRDGLCAGEEEISPTDGVLRAFGFQLGGAACDAAGAANTPCVGGAGTLAQSNPRREGATRQGCNCQRPAKRSELSRVSPDSLVNETRTAPSRSDCRPE